MAGQHMNESSSGNPSLEGLEKIICFAEQVSGEELEQLRKIRPGAVPGESPAWRAYRLAREELGKCQEQRQQDAPLVLSREEIERALSPLAAFQIILARAGETDLDIDARSASLVLGALLHASYERIGLPLLGDTL